MKGKNPITLANEAAAARERARGLIEYEKEPQAKVALLIALRDTRSFPELLLWDWVQLIDEVYVGRSEEPYVES